MKISEKVEKIQDQLFKVDSKTREYYEGKLRSLLDNISEDIDRDKLRTSCRESKRVGSNEHQSFELNC